MSSAPGLKPIPGWSNLTPMVISPESANSFIAVPSSKLVGGVLAHLDVGGLATPVVPTGVPPQAAMLKARPSPATTAFALLF